MNRSINKKMPQKGRAVSAALTLLVCFTLLSGCSGWRAGSAVIDWVDFAMTDSGTYTGMWNAVLRDPDTVTEDVIGTVDHMLNGNVHNPTYRSKPGDAAFLEKGTKLYRVEGFAPEDVLAVRADDRIGGYKLYVNDEYDELPEQEFKSILRAKPSSVGIYGRDGRQPIRTADGDERKELIDLLQDTLFMPNYRSDTGQDPLYYEIIFDTGEPILYTFGLWDDGKNIMFRESYRVDDGIREHLTPRVSFVEKSNVR